MMTNGEKYKTAQERAEAFRNFCKINVFGDCAECAAYGDGKGGIVSCALHWLDLEAEEESFEDVVEEMRNRMIDREHSPTLWPFVDRLVAAHNRVAKAAKESEAAK